MKLRLGTKSRHGYDVLFLCFDARACSSFAFSCDVLRAAERPPVLQGYCSRPSGDLWRGVLVEFDETLEFFVGVSEIFGVEGTFRKS